MGKLICEEIIPFQNIPNELWIQFQNQNDYDQQIDSVMAALRNSEGNDRVVMYLKEERKLKRLSENWSIDAKDPLLSVLYGVLGEKNVKVVQKTIEIKGKID